MDPPNRQTGATNDLYRGRYRISSARLSDLDYSAAAPYFVTICVADRRCHLGNVRGDGMSLSRAGETAQRIWDLIPQQFPGVSLDDFVVMPNHVRGIITLGRSSTHEGGHESARDDIVPVNGAPFTAGGRRDAINRVSTGGATAGHNPMLGEASLARVVRWYKGRSSYVTCKIIPDFAWQSRYYDHVIRDERTLEAVRQYIADNPKNWQLDRENPANVTRGVPSHRPRDM